MMNNQDHIGMDVEQAELIKNKARRIISVNQHLSSGALITKLKQKGIPNETIDEILETDDDKEIANAERVIESRYRLIKGKTDYERKQKLLKYLLNKGFSYQLSQQAIIRYFQRLD